MYLKLVLNTQYSYFSPPNEYLWSLKLQFFYSSLYVQSELRKTKTKPKRNFIWKIYFGYQSGWLESTAGKVKAEGESTCSSCLLLVTGCWPGRGGRCLAFFFLKGFGFFFYTTVWASSKIWRVLPILEGSGAKFNLILKGFFPLALPIFKIVSESQK